MIQNYLKVAFRQLWKHKIHLVVNVLGLGIALASCIITYLIWNFDQNFDRFHDHADQIYRVVSVKKENLQTFGVCPAPVAAAAKAEISGVQDAVVLEFRNAVLTDGKDAFREHVAFTTNGFFEWFNFPMLEGQVMLNDPGTAVITRQLAQKYFGTADPIGKTLNIYPDQSYQKQLRITGVVEDLPMNSSIRFDLVTSTANLFNRNETPVSLQDWTYVTDATFLMLKSKDDQAMVSQALQNYLPVHNQMSKDWQLEKLTLVPLTTMAHRADEIRWNALYSSLPPSMVWGMMLMSLLLLLTASLNFTNMTISLAGNRVIEIGVRKVIGGSRKQVIGQLLLEGLLVSSLALAFAVLIADWVLPHFNQMWRFLDLQWSFVHSLPLVLFLAVVLLSTTFLAAAYPALYISKFNPTGIFQDKVRFSGANLFSRILLSTQVSISTIALVAGICFTRNATFQKNADLGFEREGIQAIRIPDEQAFTVLQSEMLKNPKVQAVAGVRFHIGDSAPRIDVKIKDQKKEAEFMPIGAGYMELMNIRLLAGRTLDPQLATDFTQSMLINEQFAESYFNGEDPLGQQVTLFDSLQYTVVGVVKNFIQDSFHDPMRPLLVTLSKPKGFGYMAIKTASADMLEVRESLRSSWKDHYPQIPFEHFFQDDFLANAMEANNNIQQTFSIFALVALLLAMTGLHSLVSLNLLKRMKEITIRRILGARPRQIAYLLSGPFLLVSLLGLVVGGLVGLQLSEVLLDQIYQIHADVPYQAILLAGMVILVVAVLTVSRSLLRAITNNPAETLKNE